MKDGNDTLPLHLTWWNVKHDLFRSLSLHICCKSNYCFVTQKVTNLLLFPSNSYRSLLPINTGPWKTALASGSEDFIELVDTYITMRTFSPSWCPYKTDFWVRTSYTRPLKTLLMYVTMWKESLRNRRNLAVTRPTNIGSHPSELRVLLAVMICHETEGFLL
jgi:hypothetical protein